MENVKVIDAVMGAGKTTFMLDYINEAPQEKKFIYITPFLDEVERVKKAVTNRIFFAPTNAVEGGRKLTSLKRLVEDGANIAATHALFEMADDELIDLLMASDYVLVLDEVMDVITRASVSQADMRLLIDKNFIRIENNRVEWIASELEYDSGRFDDIRLLARAGTLFYHRDSFLVWAFPSRIFRAFSEVYVMTYLFPAQIQKYYFELFQIPYELRSVKYGQLVEHDAQVDNRTELRQLIDLYDGDHNRHGEGRTAYARGWMSRREPEDFEAMQKSIYSYVRRVAKAKAADVMWTTLKDYRYELSGKGYSKGFVPVNARATNQYADRNTLIYAYNRFMNPEEKGFFQDNGVTVNEDLLAVSDLLQWIWRSCIRNGEPIKLYIPSARMRGLLNAWAGYEL